MSNSTELKIVSSNKLESFELYENDEFKKLTPLTAGFNYVVLMVGTALVATPSVFRLTTPYLGVPTEIVLGTLAWFAAICIFNASVVLKATSFQDLGKKLFGNSLLHQFYNLIIITLPLLIVLMGLVTAYIIIASNVITFYTGIDDTIVKICLTIICGVLGILNTFNKIRLLSIFAFVSILIVVATILSMTGVFVGEVSYALKPLTFSSYVQGLPILALGFNGHMGLPGMSNEMTPANQKKVHYYTLIGQICVVIFNTSVGFFPSLLLGDQAEDDILKQYQGIWESLYGSYNIAIIIAQCLLAFIVTIQAPLLILPMKEVFLDHHGKTVHDRSLLTNIISSFILAIIGGSLSIILPSLYEALNTVATVGSLLLIGPTAAILSYKTETGTLAKIRAHLVMILGLVLLVVNIYTIFVQYST